MMPSPAEPGAEQPAPEAVLPAPGVVQGNTGAGDNVAPSEPHTTPEPMPEDEGGAPDPDAEDPGDDRGGDDDKSTQEQSASEEPDTDQTRTEEHGAGPGGAGGSGDGSSPMGTLIGVGVIGAVGAGAVWVRRARRPAPTDPLGGNA